MAVASVTETEFVKFPPLGLMVGVDTLETTAAVTLRVKTVVLVTPPPVEVTVTGKLPVGVEPLVVILRAVEQDGLHVLDEKEPLAPEGSPDTLDTLNDNA